ncbi:flagellar basal body L-ring protein [Pseudomonas saudimassiliensis]|uniref:Flagellar L-ring protein n=1 Tax=Pseudomonas saudimassiliensis TaxID=1461581 RepID=A0A078MJ11_9PSED|nr:flagellar basal body L-ring protein FlgH [Pseudomonas saudimassiliensis]CEA06245.1 flagellar basal body L-ring protein [Pseudomonas saudimassiliensis]CEF27670.1 flagellar basal body L-ring protein [Pseudomonas saudimassiliensis]
MKALRATLVVSCIASLAACVQTPPKPDDPAYAPVMPRTPMPQELNNGAIYQPGFEISLYEDRKANRIGDVITVVLTERMAAQKKAENEISKDSSVSLANPVLFGRSGIAGINTGVELGGGRDFNGEADANQSNSLSGSITVTVADVLPNGLLAVRGEKWITLNNGDELIRLSGLVRPDDVGADNSVLSTRVADARITYSGTGAFANASKPGWLSQFFMSPVWPF